MFVDWARVPGGTKPSCNFKREACRYYFTSSLRPTILNYGIGKQNSIFQHLADFFSKVPLPLNELLLVHFRGESSCIGRFCRFEFHRIVNWPSFDAACFVQFTQFRFFYRNWASWPSVGTSSLRNRPIPLDSSRKVTNTLSREKGTFFSVPGRQRLPAKGFEKSCAGFRSHDNN